MERSAQLSKAAGMVAARSGGSIDLAVRKITGRSQLTGMTVEATALAIIEHRGVVA